MDHVRKLCQRMTIDKLAAWLTVEAEAGKTDPYRAECAEVAKAVLNERLAVQAVPVAVLADAPVITKVIPKGFREVPHVEIRRTDARLCPDLDVTVEGPGSVLPLLRDIFAGAEQESFVVLMLNARNKVEGWREVARGAANNVQVPVREMFRTLLACDALSFVISHNHPSSDPTPSEPDIGLTVRIKTAADFLGLPLVDHLIIGGGTRYYSFREGGGFGSATPPPSLTTPRSGPELD